MNSMNNGGYSLLWVNTLAFEKGQALPFGKRPQWTKRVMKTATENYRFLLIAIDWELKVLMSFWPC